MSAAFCSQQGLTGKQPPEAVCTTETRPRAAQPHLMRIKLDPAPDPVLPPLLPCPAPSGISAGTQKSHPKRRLAFYSHGAASSLVPKSPPIHQEYGRREGGGAVHCVRRGPEGQTPGHRPPPLPSPPGSGRSAAFRAAAAGGRPRTAPAHRLAPAGRALGGARGSSPASHQDGRRSRSGKPRDVLRPGPQTRQAATSGPKAAPQLAG